MHHAVAWDANENNRLQALYDLQQGDLEASMDDVWAEHFAQWCGAQVSA
jgi:hypothetical protein